MLTQLSVPQTHRTASEFQRQKRYADVARQEPAEMGVNWAPFSAIVRLEQLMLSRVATTTRRAVKYSATQLFLYHSNTQC